MFSFTWIERFHVISSVRLCVIPLPLYPINSVKLLYTPLMGHQAKIMHDEATEVQNEKILMGHTQSLYGYGRSDHDPYDCRTTILVCVCITV